MEIETLSERQRDLIYCPVVRVNSDGDVVYCNQKLDVQLLTTERGDDYGSWPVYDIFFRCGHSFNDMRASLGRDNI